MDQSNRRDADHVRILVICIRAFLRETLHGVEAGGLPARGWLGAIERVLKLGESKLGRRAAKMLGIDWQHALPAAEITGCKLKPVVQLREKRLAQWLAKTTKPPVAR